MTRRALRHLHPMRGAHHVARVTGRSVRAHVGNTARGVWAFGLFVVCGERQAPFVAYVLSQARVVEVPR